MATMDSDLRWLLIGTGDIAAKRVAPALIGTAGSRLVGVCSRDEARAEAFARQFDIPSAYGFYADALARTAANAVYIATAVDQHVDLFLAAAHSGKHVLVEKPLGLNATDAARAVEAVKALSITAGCAYYRRCSARYQYARQMIADGLFGKILAIRTVYHANFNPALTDPKRWRVDPAQSGGGPLADMASHMIDLVIGLLGMPATISGIARTLVHPYQAEDTASFLLAMPDGAQVTGSFSWASDTWAHEFEIIGSRAKLRWAPCDAGPVIQTIGRKIKELDQPPAANVHAPLIADFVDAVREGHPPVASLVEATATNRVLDAIYQSSASSKVIAL